MGQRRVKGEDKDGSVHRRGGDGAGRGGVWGCSVDAMATDGEAFRVTLQLCTCRRLGRLSGGRGRAASDLMGGQ